MAEAGQHHGRAVMRGVKYEDVYLKDYETVEDLIAGIAGILRVLQRRTASSVLRNKNPAEVYRGISTFKEAA